MRIIILSFVMVLSACASETRDPADGCRTDADCNPVGLEGRFCRVNGECGCLDDSGCGDREYCNTLGSCQPMSGCRSNEDCINGEICDVVLSECFEASGDACRQDSHCRTGQICGPEQFCVQACRGDGDCGLYSLCTEEGFCDGDLQCREDQMSRCGFGDRCLGGACVPNAGPNCRPCDPQLGDGDCTRGGDVAICLLYDLDDPDHRAPGGGQARGYCGEFCREDTDCPNGMGCGEVGLVDSSDECQTAADCPAGKPCMRGEGEVRGYCGCATDADCSAFSSASRCSQLVGRCGGPGLGGFRVPFLGPCQSDQDCEPVRCNEGGQCVVARNCGIDEGVMCSSF